MPDSLPEYLRILIAAMFAFAAVGKLLQFREFSLYLGNSVGLGQILSAPWAMRVAGIVVGAELILALALGIGIGGNYPLLGAVFVMYGFSCFLALQYLGQDGDAVRCACWGRFGQGKHLATGRRIEPSDSTRVIVDLLLPVFQGGRNTLICAAAVYVLHAGQRGVGYAILLSLPVLLFFVASLMASITMEKRRLSQEVHPRYYPLSEILAPLVVLDYYRQDTIADRAAPP